ncbi:murein transglycosylase, partial [Nguyenibacter vanlangensis]|nr:murein transglycosylase [Nguyenibacter vanlangensis]
MPYPFMTKTLRGAAVAAIALLSACAATIPGGGRPVPFVDLQG